MARARGIRGATTADSNTKEAILEATTEMLESLIEANDLHIDDLAAAFFTTTEDLNAEFPTLAARRMGWEYAALLNGHEMRVPDSIKQCIRVLLLVNTEKAPRDLINVYLRGARNLRDARSKGV
jgi:chorismate mutase